MKEKLWWCKRSATPTAFLLFDSCIFWLLLLLQWGSLGRPRVGNSNTSWNFCVTKFYTIKIPLNFIFLCNYTLINLLCCHRKSILDSLSSLSRGFKKDKSVSFCEFFALICCYLSLIIQIILVPNQNNHYFFIPVLLNFF